MKGPASVVSLLLALSLASGAGNEPASSGVNLSIGGGFAYDLLGLQLAYRDGHAEGYAGLGLAGLVLRGGTAGARYYVNASGSGPFVALNLGLHIGAFNGTGDLLPGDWVATDGWLTWATLTPGFRQQWGAFFLQAGFGFGVLYWEQSYQVEPGATPRSPVPPAPVLSVVPDVLFAIGLRL